MSLAPDLDRMAVQRQFDRRAPRFEQADWLLREIERRMFERLDLVRLTPARMLDVGCGLGDGTRRLRSRYPAAQAFGIDLSAALASRARSIDRPSLGERARGLAKRLAAALSVGNPVEGPAGGTAVGGTAVGSGGGPLAGYVSGDAHRLPFAGGSFDLVWSSLAYQWFDDPVAAIAEWYRVIRPGGLLMFGALGVDTLRELRAAGHPTMAFPDMHDIGDALVAAGFAEPVMDTERITVTWTEARRMRDDLHALGGDASRGRRRGLASPRRLANALRRLEAGQPIAVSFELTYGHAWCPSSKRLPEGYAPIEFSPSRRRPPAE